MLGGRSQLLLDKMECPNCLQGVDMAEKEKDEKRIRGNIKERSWGGARRLLGRPQEHPMFWALDWPLHPGIP